MPGRDGVEREYTVPLPSAELGLWCQMMADAAGRIHSTSTVEEMQEIIARIEEEVPELSVENWAMTKRVLGTAYDEMAADGVSHHHIQFCGHTAYAWIVGGEEPAERFWKSGGQGEAPGPANRQERRAAGRTSTASASGTRKAASSRTTKSRSASSKSTKATASRGTRS
ncbi:DUF7426 family protein [Paractinoplanes pyxinae]|uniref:DUF7426 family protein n=1 Tax=Paractinoplanes pyxinae TaxID=2997416 RepID=UPI003F693158